MPMTSDHHWESLSPVEKERQRVEMHKANIKGRFDHLKIEWTEEILEQAMKRDGGGITAYLRAIAEHQEKVREHGIRVSRQRNPEWGSW
uniref:Uncharacterized protein n=1 Tax=Pseudomonas phage Nican01 TaxID=3138540 RepID=A0AAU6W1S5_9CAUD